MFYQQQPSELPSNSANINWSHSLLQSAILLVLMLCLHGLQFYYASLTSSILPHVCKGGSLPSSYLMNYGWNGFLQIARRNVLTTKPHVCRCTHVQDDFKLIINDRKRKTATHNSREVSTSKKLRHDHLGVHNSHLMSKESPRSSNEGRQRSLMNHNLNRIMNIDLIQKQLSELEQRQQADREELLLIVRS